MRWLVLLGLLAVHAALGETLTGKVIGISDGDTLTVLVAEKKQHRIRIAGIDAPERGQPFGDRSRQSLYRLAAGKDATLHCHKIDRYQRKVCKVMVQPVDCSRCGYTVDVGLAQVIAGLAWWFGEYAKEQSPEDRGRYESEEHEARLRKRGLWREPNPIPPWVWRSTSRTMPSQ